MRDLRQVPGPGMGAAHIEGAVVVGVEKREIRIPDAIAAPHQVIVGLAAVGATVYADNRSPDRIFQAGPA